MRKTIVCFIAVLAFATACPVPQKPAEAPPRAPEQAVTDPATGQNVTAEYLQGQLENYIRYRDRIFEDAKRRIAAGENQEKVYEELLKELVELQKATDNAVKHIPQIGDTNLPQTFEEDQRVLRQITGGASEF